MAGSPDPASPAFYGLLVAGGLTVG